MNRNDENFNMIMDLFGLAETQIHEAKRDYVKQQKKAIKNIDELIQMVDDIPVSD